MKCKYWKKCKWYKKDSETCNKDGGIYHGGDDFAGCYYEMKNKTNKERLFEFDKGDFFMCIILPLYIVFLLGILVCMDTFSLIVKLILTTLGFGFSLFIIRRYISCIKEKR